jgi:hypothetical protein
MPKVSNLGWYDAGQRIARSFSKYKSFDMSWFDLTTMVDDISSWCNDYLSHVKAVPINLRVSEGDKDLVVASSSPNTVHLFGLWAQTVSVILFKERKRVLEVDPPLPVRISRNPYHPKLAHLPFFPLFLRRTGLWKSDQFASFLAGFIDESNGLLNRLLQVEPCWL